MNFGIENPDIVFLSRRKAATVHLGPGTRAALWVAGCSLGCPECIAPETHAPGNVPVPVSELADWIAKRAQEGVTVSGGEPMEQAAGVASVIDQARSKRPDLHVMLYTGHRMEDLRRKGSPAQKALLDCVDLLVDGRYVRRQHAALLWRGSRNQRLIDLTGRTTLADFPDEPAGLEFELLPDLTLELTGVPPVPGFRAWLEGHGS